MPAAVLERTFQMLKSETEMIEIKQELKTRKSDALPVVALETSIVSHGMPYPKNVSTALEVEAAVRESGGIPATVGIVNGRIKVGLSEAEIEHFGRAEGIRKVSRADLAVAIARGETGATTVSATMLCAKAAGIEVFATGGIGGVHFGAENTFDISQDLHELSQTAVVVVSSGPKAILDVGKTLEVLETLGVPLAAYGQDELPAFWSSSSGYKAPLRMDHPKEIANSFLVRKELGIPGGFLVANPVPAHFDIPKDVSEIWIKRALEEASSRDVSGKAVTPFLLNSILEISEGRSIASNVELVKSNARLGAKIAKKIADAGRTPKTR